jgi:putative membrane protein
MNPILKSQVKQSRQASLVASIFCLSVHLYLSLRISFFPWLPFPYQGVSLNLLICLLFSLFHSVYVIGYKRTWVFFGLSGSISWLYEEIGVATGAIYGPYHYSDMLGLKLWHVPLLIPLAWFMMIYPSFMVVRIITDGEIDRSIEKLKKIFVVAFLASMTMTGWDVVMDPQMVSQGYWVWEQGGPYFGVPVRNFFGWMLTCFSVYSCYGLYEFLDRPKILSLKSGITQGPLNVWVTALPVVAYSSYIIRGLFNSNIPELAVVAFFSMGFPAAFAWGRLLSKDRIKR